MVDRLSVQADLENRFKHHPPSSPEVAHQYGMVRETMLEVAVWVTAATPASREQSLALTKLEEAMFWANAAIARRDAPTQSFPQT